LGLATEDGGVIYFAKEVKAQETLKAVLEYSEKGKEIYTENQLKEFLKQRVGQWMKPEDIDAMFSWL
jgi:phosphorylcholine metabolism protein LicD